MPISRDAEAVSPVVAAILLVAVTVVLAGVVLLFSGRVADETPEVAPAVDFQEDEANDEAMVSALGAPVAWRDLQVSGCDQLLVLDTAGAVLDVLLDSEAPVQAGQRITGCQPGETLTVVHTPSNTLLYRHSFA